MMSTFVENVEIDEMKDKKNCHNFETFQFC